MLVRTHTVFDLPNHHFGFMELITLTGEYSPPPAKNTNKTIMASFPFIFWIVNTFSAFWYYNFTCFRTDSETRLIPVENSARIVENEVMMLFKKVFTKPGDILFDHFFSKLSKICSCSVLIIVACFIFLSISGILAVHLL